METMKTLYATYTEACKLRHQKPRALKTFRTKAQLQEAIAEMKSRRKMIIFSGKTTKLTKRLDKVQRALARRWCERYDIPRPERWQDAVLPVELVKVLNAPAN